jgi:hypothetical protein
MASLFISTTFVFPCKIQQVSNQLVFVVKCQTSLCLLSSVKPAGVCCQVSNPAGVCCQVSNQLVFVVKCQTSWCLLSSVKPAGVCCPHIIKQNIQSCSVKYHTFYILSMNYFKYLYFQSIYRI